MKSAGCLTLVNPRYNLPSTPAGKESKTVTLTREGKSRLRKAAPLWRAVQRRVVKQFGSNRWSTLKGELEEILRSVRAAE